MNYGYCEFKPIEQNPIILDFTGCKYLGEIHLILKHKFGLPDYYGENWDALWDCLKEMFLDFRNVEVEIYGFYLMGSELIEACEPMLNVFNDVMKETPNVLFKIIS